MAHRHHLLYGSGEDKTTRITFRLFRPDARWRAKASKRAQSISLSYLSISTKIIFRVTSVEEAERPYSDQPSSRFSTSYIFTAVPIGEIEGSSYVPGVVDLPMVGSNVYACDESILKRVFCVREGVEIGSLAGYDSVRPTFDIDSLFSGHLAILGNTGSGKSSTARSCLIGRHRS